MEKDMKKLALMFAMIFATYFVKAQDARDDIPAEVQATFSERFPDVAMEDVNWEEEDFYYEAEFEKEGQDHEARIDLKGNLVSIKADLDADNVPAEVQEGLTSQYGEHQVNDVKMFETSESTIYKLDIETAQEEHEIYTDGEGQLIEKADS
jgi:hypothetical protein